jgi:hypothetical protein
MKNTLSKIDKKLMNNGMIAWLMEIDKQEAFWKATGIKRSLSLPLMPSTQVPEKDLKHTPDNPDDK